MGKDHPDVSNHQPQYGPASPTVVGRWAAQQCPSHLQAFRAHWLQAPRSGPPMGAGDGFGANSSTMGLWSSLQPSAGLFSQPPITPGSPSVGSFPSSQHMLPHTQSPGPNMRHRVTHTLILLNAPLVRASCPAQHLLHPWAWPGTGTGQRVIESWNGLVGKGL